MSNAIRFLETLGQDPALSRLSPQQLQAMIDTLDIDEAQRDALLAGDASVLNQLVGGREKMGKLVWEPGREAPAEGDEPDSDADEEAPEDAPDKA